MNRKALIQNPTQIQKPLKLIQLHETKKKKGKSKNRRADKVYPTWKGS